VIDFTPVLEREIQVIDFAKDFTRDDLRDLTNESIDTLLQILDGLTDGDVTFLPHDPEAHDPEAATEDEKHIGWSLAHLVAHVTASSEEGAAFSSLLARGIPAKERPRYETPWREITTHAQCVQRLEESRRMRLAYLETWPDEPFLDVHRDVSEKFTDYFGLMNAPAAFLFGLAHEVGHYDQFREVRRQALEARQTA
jgi:hypothetical protein